MEFPTFGGKSPEGLEAEIIMSEVQSDSISQWEELIGRSITDGERVLMRICVSNAATRLTTAFMEFAERAVKETQDKQGGEEK